ncbi:unnamed protein product (macronuclear) [Paramecium tetraurelia]|uniref:Uncharacterized protein n=1 Tax=Paramecium tetraurelia TaxID=5888 RepID=A0BSQ5_PARTE|nr:uncharacterized protein GSPATT00031804001 [Paramecium tetraurelia]CAK61572.1 unnamed protein product [Paramecium tetraurelia]|eukprot:XP_001428970.1 hypothetical protein (macronuclear) [Paramecium tetraurelia strain d4-2]
MNIKPEKKQKYKSVNSEERSKIINYFIEGSLSASQIAQITGHNLSTIKAIFRIYRNEGRINKKEKRDREVHIQKNVAVFIVDDQTRSLKFISKQHMKQEVILRSHDKFCESQIDILNETLQKSASEVRNNLNSFQSKRNFDQALQRMLTNGKKEDDFINISSNTTFQLDANTRVNVSKISNLLKNKEDQLSKKAPLLTPQKTWFKQDHQLTDLKRVFELQVQEYLGKSHSDNLK